MLLPPISDFYFRAEKKSHITSFDDSVCGGGRMQKINITNTEIVIEPKDYLFNQ